MVWLRFTAFAVGLLVACLPFAASPSAALPAEVDSPEPWLQRLHDPVRFAEAAWARGGLSVAAPPTSAAPFLEAALALAAAADLPADERALVAFEAREPALASALAPLLAASADALLLTRAALAPLTPAEAERLETHALEQAGALGHAPTVLVDAGGAPAVPAAPRDAVAAAAAKVDPALLALAAATAADGALRALRDLAPVRPTGVLSDQCPLFRVYDLAADAHGASDDACMVIVDLGGDDHYTSRAAGAIGLVGTPATLLRVVVDVVGDDTYTHSAAGATGLVAQGAATLGVGVLVDGAGSDTYAASLSGTIGSTGNGCFAVGSAATLAAQGAGVVGAGVLLDGAGADRRDAVVTSHGNTATLLAQGAGQLGAGALVEDFAADASLASDDENVALAESLPWAVSPTLTCVGAGLAVAQGAGNLGAGARGDGLGHDEDDVRARGGAAMTVAHGAGNLGGGVLADATGDDERRAAAEGDLSLTVGGPGCWSSVSVTIVSGSTTTLAQGGALLGAGLLVDGHGDDVNHASASSRATGRALADNACSLVPTASASISNGGARVHAHGGSQAGAGVSLDGVGDDDYRAEAESLTIAEALAASPLGPGLATASATGGDALSYAQADVDGIGAGVLVDGLGDDAYANSATSVVTTIVNGFVTAAPGPTHAGVAATNGACWTNAPPGLEAGSPGVGAGLDADPAPPAGCVLPPW